MKKSILATLFILSLHLINAQSPLEWVKDMGATLNDRGESVVVDSIGNVYTTGFFRGTVDFDPNAGISQLSSVGDQDVFISKLDVSGNFVWAKSIGSTSMDGGKTIALDKSGNVYVAGNIQGITDLDPGVGVYTINPSGQGSSFILKLDALGNFIWAKNFGGSLADMEIDRWGNIYATGDFPGTFDFDPNIGVYNLTATGITDAFILKLNNSGNFVWAKSLNTTLQVYSWGIAVDTLGNVYTAGNYRNTIDLDPGPGTFTFSAAGFDDMFFSKLDASGNFVWGKSIGSSSNDLVLAITLDNAGNLYSTGSFVGTVDFDPNAGISSLSSSGNFDIFVLKLSSAGNYVWAKNMGGSSTDEGRDITLDKKKNVITTGWFSGTADFDPDINAYNLTASPFSYDIYISQLDSSGNFILAYQMGGTAYDQGLGIAADTLGNVHTTGYFGSTVDFDPDSSTVNLTSQGVEDIFIHKLNLCALNTSVGSVFNVLCNGDATGAATILASGSGAYTFSWSPGGGASAFENGLNAGTYTCIVRNGCQVSSTLTVSISEPPPLTLTVAANYTAVCSGSLSVLTASAGGGAGSLSYQWLNGPFDYSMSVTPVSNSVFTAMVQDSNSCQVTQTIAITAYQLPALTVLSGASLTCPGETVTLTAGGAGTFSWSTGETDSVIVISPVMTSSYTVVGTGTNGCENSLTYVQNVQSCNGIKDLGLTESDIRIFPNPFSDKISISGAKDKTLEILNCSGALMENVVIRDDQSEISLSHLENGLYFLKLGKVVQKQVKAP